MQTGSSVDKLKREKKGKLCNDSFFILIFCFYLLHPYNCCCCWVLLMTLNPTVLSRNYQKEPGLQPRLHLPHTRHVLALCDTLSPACPRSLWHFVPSMSSPSLTLCPQHVLTLCDTLSLACPRSLWHFVPSMSSPSLTLCPQHVLSLCDTLSLACPRSLWHFVPSMSSPSVTLCPQHVLALYDTLSLVRHPLTLLLKKSLPLALSRCGNSILTLVTFSLSRRIKTNCLRSQLRVYILCQKVSWQRARPRHTFRKELEERFVVVVPTEENLVRWEKEDIRIHKKTLSRSVEPGSDLVFFGIVHSASDKSNEISFKTWI